MNERIKKLVEQARKYARDYVTECKHYAHYMEHNEYELRFEEKFAELIVRECADVAWMNTPETEELEYSNLISDKIKEHFGVE